MASLYLNILITNCYKVLLFVLYLKVMALYWLVEIMCIGKLQLFLPDQSEGNKYIRYLKRMCGLIRVGRLL